jgi:chromosome segregation ATPase
MLGIKTKKQKLREETARELIESASLITELVENTGENVKILKESLSHLGDAVSSLNEMMKLQESRLNTLEEGITWAVDESVSLREDFVSLVRHIRTLKEDREDGED